MLIDLTQQTDKLLFVGMPPRAMRARCGDIRYCPAPLGIVTLRKSLFDAPAKASPVQGEVAKIFDFCRRGCCRSKLPLRRYLCEFEAFPTQSLSQLRCQPPAGGPVAALTVHRTVIHSRDCASLTLYTREPWALPRQYAKQRFARGNDTECGASRSELKYDDCQWQSFHNENPMVLRQLQAVVTHLQPAMPANNNLSLC